MIYETIETKSVKVQTQQTTRVMFYIISATYIMLTGPREILNPIIWVNTTRVIKL